MPVLNDKVLAEVKKSLANMVKPVTLKLFTQSFECGYCEDTRLLLTELSAAHELLTLEIHQFESDFEAVDRKSVV